MSRIGEFARFVLVGGASACINLGLLYLLVTHVGWGYLTACIVCFFALNFISYFINKIFTFRMRAAVKSREVVTYYAVMAASLGLNLLLMVLLVDGLKVHYLLASAITSVLLAIVNFLAHSDVTFRARLRGAETREGPRRILQVSAFFPAHGGGIEVVAGRLAEHLAEAGEHVHWMAGGAASEQPASRQRSLSIRQARSIDMLERRLGLPSPIWSPASLGELWSEVGRSDVVHVHDYLYMPTLIAMVMAALRGKPVVLTQHIGMIPFESRVARTVLQVLNHTLGRLVMGLVSQAVFVGRPVLSYFAAFSRFRRPPQLIANGVDHAMYQPPAQHLSVPPVKLLFVGRFVEKKGLGLLAHCVDVPGARWTFIGWGPMSPAHWGERAAGIEIHTGLRAEQLVPFFQAADLLVLPSTGEGFPLVIQEALACGTPVLVSTEVAEAFPAIDPSCVFDVELRRPDAASALHQRLLELSAAPDRLAAARQPAQTLALQWSWPICVDAYRSIYETVSPQGSRR